MVIVLIKKNGLVNPTYPDNHSARGTLVDSRDTDHHTPRAVWLTQRLLLH
jgi:hypothetical protein